MNLIEIAGHLGADPEERFTATGKRVVSLRVAARAGKEDTIWWRVNIWDDRFDRMLPHFKKGSSIIVVGEMRKPETYTAKDGTTQISLSMTAEMLKFSPFGRGDRGEGQGYQPSTAQQEPFAAAGASSAQEPYAPFGGGGSTPPAGDDLPF